MTLLLKLLLIWISLIFCSSLMNLNISLKSNQYIDIISIDDKVIFNGTPILESLTPESITPESPVNYTLESISATYGQSINIFRANRYYEQLWIEAIIHSDEKETWNSSSFWMWTINKENIKEEDYVKYSLHFNSKLVLFVNATSFGQKNTFTFTIPYICSCQNDTVISPLPKPISINMSTLISPKSLDELGNLLKFQIISISHKDPLGTLVLENNTQVMKSYNYSIQNITYNPIKSGEKVNITYIAKIKDNSTNQCTITIAFCEQNCATCRYQYGMTSCETCVEGFWMDENRICSLRCGTGCKKCSILGECDNCLDNYYLKDDDPYYCYQGLITGYYFEDRFLKYLPCSKNCLICSNRFDCHICNDGYYFFNGNCIQNFTSIEDAFKNIKANIKYYAEEIRYIEQENFIFEINSLQNNELTKTNKTSYIDFNECGPKFSEKYQLDLSELYLLKVDITNNESLTNTVKFNIIKNDGTILDPSICKSLNYSYPVKTEMINNYDTMYSFINEGIDLFNPHDNFFSSICVINNKIDMDLSIKVRQSEYYINKTFCKEGCNYLSFDYNQSVINCVCEINQTDEMNDKLDTPMEKDDLIPAFLWRSLFIFPCYSLFTSERKRKNWQLISTTTINLALLIKLVPFYFLSKLVNIENKIKEEEKKKKQEEEEKKKREEEEKKKKEEEDNQQNIINNNDDINNDNKERKKDMSSERNLLNNKSQISDIDKTCISSMEKGLLKNDITNNDPSLIISNNEISNIDNHNLNANQMLSNELNKEQNENILENKQDNINDINNYNNSINNSTLGNKKETLEFEKMTLSEAIKYSNYPKKEIFVYYFYIFTPFLQGCIKCYNSQISFFEMAFLGNVALLSCLIDMFINGFFFLEDNATQKFYENVMGSVLFQILKNAISFFSTLGLSVFLSFFLHYWFRQILKGKYVDKFLLKYILFVLLELCFACLTFYHHSLIGFIYSHSSWDILLGELLSILFNYIFIVIVCFFIVFIRSIAICCQSNKVFCIQMWLYNIFDFILG